MMRLREVLRCFGPKQLIEFDEPYEHGFVVVAEFAYKCCKRGLTWKETRAEVLKRLAKVITE